MITVKEAKALIDSHTKPMPVIMIPLIEASGSVIADNIIAPMEFPLFDQSAMDGYAIKLDESCKEYQVQIEIAAGDTEDKILELGKSAKIFTGAAVPENADTIVIRENVVIKNNSITFDPKLVRKGDNIRKKGSQTKRGDIILKKGTRLTPACTGFLAMLGIRKVPVYSSPRIGIITTGNEIILPGETILKGQVYNSNLFLLTSVLYEGRIEPVFIEHISDQKDFLESELRRLIPQCDILLISGGVSGGDYDHVKDALHCNKAKEVFWKVAQRPGKVLYFGVKDETLIFGLPGNPGATLTCFYEYVVPCIRKASGFNNNNTFKRTLILDQNVTLKQGFTWFMKGITDDESVHILPEQESYKLDTFAASDCIVEIPRNVMQEGETVQVTMLNHCWI